MRAHIADRTGDGSTLLTHSEDEGLRTFVLPPDLLDHSPSSSSSGGHDNDDNSSNNNNNNNDANAKHLRPYSIVHAPSRVYATAVYPHSKLSDPSSLLFLCSPRETPIRLHSLLQPAVVASYPLVNPSTEKHETPYALLIPPTAPHTFVAGTTSQISIFDLNRDGGEPIAALKTIPTRRSPATTTTMKGLVTALAVTSEGLLAAGTYSRQVGLYANHGAGECVGVFWLPEDGGEGKGAGAGAGVTQLLWSADARYLYIAERCSEDVLVYDIRVTGHMVERLRGRAADSNQRMGMDVAHALGGEVVAGGTDGTVRIWEPLRESGGGGSVGGWQAHADPVTGAAVHPSGLVMATCSGERKTFGLVDKGWVSGSESENDDSSSSGNGSSTKGGALWDNSLKVWELPRTVVQMENAQP